MLACIHRCQSLHLDACRYHLLHPSHRDSLISIRWGAARVSVWCQVLLQQGWSLIVRPGPELAPWLLGHQVCVGTFYASVIDVSRSLITVRSLHHTRKPLPGCLEDVCAITIGL